MFWCWIDMSFVVLVITGKGPQKDMYRARMQKLMADGKLRRCHFYTLWLAQADYPKILGSADLGVCLHTSSSGLDLPMKVVDMFGAGLPVCAVDYACIDELVRHGHNGFVFSGEQPKELAGRLLQLFDGFPHVARPAESTDRSTPVADRKTLACLREGVKDFLSVRWEDNWQQVAAQFFRH